MTHYVYLFRTDEFYKIGTAKNIEDRLRALLTVSPYEISIVKTWQFDGVVEARYAEVKLHNLFRRKQAKRRSEWFRLNSDDISLLDQLCTDSINQNVKINLLPNWNEAWKTQHPHKTKSRN